MAALVVPGRWAAEIDGIRRALGSAEIDRIPPHVTLVPPVNVRSEDVPVVADLVGNVAVAFAPLPLDIGPAATFLPASPVCYLAVGGEPAVLASLSNLVTSIATGPLAPPAGRRPRAFVPHVTVNQRMDAGRIPPAVATLDGYCVRVVFEGVTLLEHDESGRRWEVLFEASFEGRVVIGRGGLEVELSVTDRLDPAAGEWLRRAFEQYDARQLGPDVRTDEPFAVTARLGAGVAGVAEGTLQGVTCHLSSLMVAPDLRGIGVGTKLLQAVEHHAATRGCTRIRLETLEGERAEGFYRGRGYRVTATLPRWRELRDFVLMERDF